MKTKILACIVGVVILAFVGLLFFSKDLDRYYTWHETINKTRMLSRACIAYRNHPKYTKRYPASLDELTLNNLIDEPDYSLRDGWGKRLRYVVMLNENGEDEIYIWSERIVKDEMFLCGAKVTADGKVIDIGLPPY